MPHGLQPNRVESRCEWRKIMREEIYLSRHSGGKNKQANDQQPSSAVAQCPGKREQRGQKEYTGEKEYPAKSFHKGHEWKARTRVNPVVILQFVDLVESTHLRVMVGRLWSGLLPYVIG